MPLGRSKKYQFGNKEEKMSHEENQQRLSYRESPGAIRFAFKSILLALLFGSLFFVLIPLTSKLVKEEEKDLRDRHRIRP